MPRPKSKFPCGFGEQPWLIQTPGSEKETQTFINPLNGSVEERTIPEMDGQLCLSRFEEWLFLVDDLSDDCFLLNMYSLEKISLSPIEEPFASLGLCILTSPPTSPDCAIIFLGREENFILFCQPFKCKTGWTKLPVEFNVVEASRMLPCNRKLYILLDIDVEVIGLASLSTNFVEATSMDKPEFWSFGIGFVDHLVESCGDIFFVRTRFPSLPKASSIIDFEIYQLDIENKNNWMRVEGIGDSTFFLDRHGGQSFCRYDPQFDQNCIYHVLSCYDGERIYKICLDDQTISFNLLPANAVQGQCSFYWILPVRAPIQKHAHLTSSETIAGREVCQKRCYLVNQHKNKDVPISIAMPLAELPIDIMQTISEQLPLKDAGRLRAVCKPWAQQLPNPMKEGMWLMYCPKICGACQMYNPFKGKQFTLNMKKLSSFDMPTRLLFSKEGWVLALKGSNFLCLMNPFTNDFHHLPRLKDNYSYKGIAFSCAPKNSLNCVVFAISGPPRGDFLRIITWHYGKKKWFKMQFKNKIPFHVANNNPVFFHGEFYCLSRRGNLGVFNPENNTWRVLDKPQPIYLDAVPDIGTEYCYLMECNGQLISVFQTIDMDNVRVFKFNRSKMAWTFLEDLGDLTLFLDYRTSIAKTLPCKSYNNKLYLPRLHDETDKATFYYCMKSRMHNTGIKSLRVPYNCVWLEPHLQ